MRAGGYALTLLGAPRNFLILRSLGEGRKSQLDLRRDAGSPPRSTLRGTLAALETAGATSNERGDSFAGPLAYDLTEAGRELLKVAATLERWLADAPSKPIEMGSDQAKAAIRGLVEGWCSSVLPILAAGPLSLTELDKQISTVSYPTLERCLDTMRLAEQLEIGERSPKGTPYALTDWMRRGLSSLALGARWEHRHRPDGIDPVSRDDIDDAMMLGGPLFKLSETVSGVCQLAVKIPDGKEQRRALAYLEVRDGKMRFETAYSEVKPDAWASGTLDTWFATVIDADTAGLRISGDRGLAGAIIEGVHDTLFEGKADQRDNVAQGEAQG